MTIVDDHSLTVQLAKKWHPDSNKEKGAQARFIEIQSAYDVSLTPNVQRHGLTTRFSPTMASAKHTTNMVRLPRRKASTLTSLGVDSAVSKTLAALEAAPGLLAISLNRFSEGHSVPVVEEDLVVDLVAREHVLFVEMISKLPSP